MVLDSLLNHNFWCCMNSLAMAAFLSMKESKIKRERWKEWKKQHSVKAGSLLQSLVLDSKHPSGLGCSASECAPLAKLRSGSWFRLWQTPLPHPSHHHYSLGQPPSVVQQPLRLPAFQPFLGGDLCLSPPSRVHSFLP